GAFSHLCVEEWNPHAPHEIGQGAREARPTCRPTKHDGRPRSFEDEISCAIERGGYQQLGCRLGAASRAEFRAPLLPQCPPAIRDALAPVVPAAQDERLHARSWELSLG